MTAPTLKSKAVRLLAQREHSREELKSKLLRHTQQQSKRQTAWQRDAKANDAQAAADSGSQSSPQSPREDDGPALHAQLLADIDRTIDSLTQSGLQSDERTAQALLQAQGRRLGGYRLKQKLQAKGLQPELVAQALTQTQGTEYQRAFDLWSRRFGHKLPSSDASPAERRAEQARQARFLISRGFGSDIVRKIVRGSGSGQSVDIDGLADD